MTFIDIIKVYQYNNNNNLSWQLFKSIYSIFKLLGSGLFTTIDL
jgi:hypothetical protein